MEKYGDAQLYLSGTNGSGEFMEDNLPIGPLPTARMDDSVVRVEEFLHSDLWLSDHLDISYGSIQRNITANLNMRTICAKFIPKVLTRSEDDVQVNLRLWCGYC